MRLYWTHCEGHILDSLFFYLLKLAASQRWEAVQGEEVTFPKLEKLVIESCPELTSLPEAPNLSELEIHRGSQQMLVQVANCIVTASSLSKLVLHIDDDSEAAWLDGDSLIQLVDGKKKQNHNKSPSPLTVMELQGCNVFFSHSSALALWACLVQLEDLEIRKCEALVHWPEEVFQSLKSLRSLRIRDCNNLTGRNGLTEVLDLPPSIKNLIIYGCSNLQALSGQLDAVQTLHIWGCSSLKSLESLLGELALLEELYLSDCKSLVSLPNGPQAYSSLSRLTIKSCPGIKLLPQSLEQRLGDLKDEDKQLDAHYYQETKSSKYWRHFCA